MTAAAKSLLPPEESPELRRWLISAAIVIALHGSLLLWLMHKRDISAAGAPPAVVMIDLPAMDVAPASEVLPDAVEGPKMTKAQPQEEVETPEAMAVPELPPAHKPEAVLMPPPKPKLKPKKNEIPKSTVKQTHEPPVPRTSAPKHSEAARGQMSAALSRGTAGSAASIASWRTQINAHLLRHKPTGGEGAGVVTISFSLARSGALIGAHLTGSSGSSALDQRALEMVRRANPFPAAPPEVTGGAFPFTVPVRFR
ncbi:MAG TPA: TonB family protein [Methylocella sp.]|nr:TonB family protein [Methylocella sp.]